MRKVVAVETVLEVLCVWVSVLARYTTAKLLCFPTEDTNDRLKIYTFFMRQTRR